MPFLIFLIVFAIFLVLISIRQVNQYERGIKFILGRYLCTVEPGWRIVWPIFQSMHKVDIRVKAVDVPDQDAITKDNVTVNVNAVLYYKVIAVEKAFLEVEDFFYATSQLAQTTMRDVVGEVSLDELLGKRDQISNRIQQIVDAATDPWGIKIVSVDLKHIELPKDMQRTIAKQAEAEREKRAVIIKAEGEVIAAENMAKAAKTLAGAQGALHLRTLQSINDLSSDQSNTVVFALPLEVLRAFEGMANKK
ncbi:slipin family protein [Patescibacteria group bacterium]|nr:slipin family protein [Patescibacteria group bacterium]